MRTASLQEIRVSQARSTDPKTVSLFVFIPFCKTICTYCDFNVYAHLGSLFIKYVEAVCTEIAAVSNREDMPRLAKSLAFGGGTPSILPVDLIATLFDSIHKDFDILEGSEVTLEANPGTVDREKLVSLRALGVNRLSLGFQSFDDERLRQFNRNHNSKESREAFDLARKSGFDNINIDMIYGLPDQSVSTWESELERALAYEPEHLSLYALQVEEKTPLARQVSKGRVTSPDPDVAAEMFTVAEDKLSVAGYEHYEISNYAKPGFRSKHNLTYWLNQPYLGFGAGAHSFFKDERWSNVNKPAKYIEALETGRSAVAEKEHISPELEIGETLMVGLRLGDGVDLQSFRQRFGVDLRKKFGETIAQLQGWDLLTVDEDRIRLTRRGQLVSNQVLWRFLPD